jgi:magnesium-protoporphyrin O-methyltransferase
MEETVAQDAEYGRHRDRIASYFDERAHRWDRLTSERPVGRIRATVREGRRRMHDTVRSWLPEDIKGARILDAGCGTGSLAIALAEEGADVTAMDVSEAVLDVARERIAPLRLSGSVAFLHGDLVRPSEAVYDYVVAVDSFIHYPERQLGTMVEAQTRCAKHGVLFTFAPWTTLLATMHAVGKLFPSSNRSPAIQPVRESRLRSRLWTVRGWTLAETARVHVGFYHSCGVRLVRSGVGKSAAVAA